MNSSSARCGRSPYQSAADKRPGAGMTDRAQFIRANTRLMTPPLVPEIRLHLAEELVPIWRKTEEELGAMNVPPPYWAFAWAGGQALARYLLDHPELARGKSVLDLGSGSGLTAIAALKAGAREVCAADIDTLALASVIENAQANYVTISTTNVDLLATPPQRAWDLVLVGDLFYERALADAVIAFIDAVARAGRGRADRRSAAQLLPARAVHAAGQPTACR